jgi:hypothetical protein
MPLKTFVGFNYSLAIIVKILIGELISMNDSIIQSQPQIIFFI